jgi:hypothetical protein
MIAPRNPAVVSREWAANAGSQDVANLTNTKTIWTGPARL